MPQKLIPNHRTINSKQLLKPFLENVIRDFVLDTKRLEGFSMRQSLRLVLKVKPFKIFTAIHNSKIWLAAKLLISINSHFLTAYVLYVLNELLCFGYFVKYIHDAYLSFESKYNKAKK